MVTGRLVAVLRVLQINLEDLRENPAMITERKIAAYYLNKHLPRVSSVAILLNIDAYDVLLYCSCIIEVIEEDVKMREIFEKIEAQYLKTTF